MIKDPLHTEETPYDLLGLKPDARPAEVHQAMLRFMAQPRNLPRLQLGMQASQRLKNPSQRLAVDFLYYDVAGLEPEAGPEPPPLALQDLIQVPFLRPEDLFCDLDRGDFSQDLGDIRFHHFSFLPEDGFDNLAGYRLDVQLED